MNWITLSIISLLLLSVMSFLITILAKKGYPVSFILLGIGIVFTVAFFFQTFVFSPHTFTVSFNTIFLLLLIGVLSTIGNLFLYQAASNAPNAGLAFAIGGLQAVLVSVFAFIFLKDKLTPLQIIGVILAVFAIILINLGGVSAKPNHTNHTAVAKANRL